MSRFIYIPESDDQNENVLQADVSDGPTPIAQNIQTA